MGLTLDAFSRARPTLRLVPGELESKNGATRMILPTAVQPAWPPFERVGEVIASRARESPAHVHQGQEVLTYIVEGTALYQAGAESPQRLPPGSTRLLTAPVKSTHRVGPAGGSPIRWFALVAALPAGTVGPARIQGSRPVPSGVQPDGTIIRRVAGAESGVASTVGLQATDIEFAHDGTTFHEIGHRRRGVLYALSGRGAVDGQTVEPGEGVLIEHSAGIAVHGPAGFRVMLSTVPYYE